MSIHSTGLSDEEKPAAARLKRAPDLKAKPKKFDLADWQHLLVVKPATAWRILSCSNTRGYELLKKGEIISFLDGRSRKIPTESIKTYIARLLAARTPPCEPTMLAAAPRRRGRPPRKYPIAATPVHQA